MKSSNQPLVSILINNYNYQEFLKESVDSALAQTYPNLEIIVVDDGSTDNSRQIIDSYGAKIIPIYQQNKGQASTFNQGFAASKGEIIFLLDADDIFHREKVAIVVKSLQDNVGCEWCFHPLLLFTQEDKQELVKQDSLNLTSEQIQQQNVQPIMAKGKLGDPFSFPIPATSGMCFTRSLANKLLPMPIADGIILNDSYLKFAALGISKGITIEQELAYQRIHDRNLFTTVDDCPTSLNETRRKMAAIFINTAYWLKAKFPPLIKYANNIFAVGLALYWRAGSKDQQSPAIVREYCSQTNLKSMIFILLRSSYKYLQSL
jgi:glycosyltransferase involved in cell wall biosynthesis